MVWSVIVDNKPDETAYESQVVLAGCMERFLTWDEETATEMRRKSREEMEEEFQTYALLNVCTSHVGNHSDLEEDLETRQDDTSDIISGGKWANIKQLRYGYSWIWAFGEPE
jgi:hypothetical protein